MKMNMIFLPKLALKVIIFLTVACLCACSQSPDIFRESGVIESAAQSESESLESSVSEKLLLLRGGLRTDIAPSDAPFDKEAIIEAYEQTAFGIERNSNYELDNYIRRFEKPVKYIIISYDPSGMEDRYVRTSYAIRAFLKKMTNLTGIEIKEVTFDSLSPGEDIQIVYYLLKREERNVAIPALPVGEFLKKNYDASVQAMFDDTNDTGLRCPSHLNYNSDDLKAGIYWTFIPLNIRLSDLQLEMCIQEETAQMFGVQNDSAFVRPSIFNDDQEFAYLTDLDSVILRIHYDKRLHSGMQREQVMPTVREIANDYVSSRDDKELICSPQITPVAPDPSVFIVKETERFQSLAPPNANPFFGVCYDRTSRRDDGTLAEVRECQGHPGERWTNIRDAEWRLLESFYEAAPDIHALIVRAIASESTDKVTQDEANLEIKSHSAFQYPKDYQPITPYIVGKAVNNTVTKIDVLTGEKKQINEYKKVVSYAPLLTAFGRKCVFEIRTDRTNDEGRAIHNVNYYSPELGLTVRRDSFLGDQMQRKSVITEFDKIDGLSALSRL